MNASHVVAQRVVVTTTRGVAGRSLLLCRPIIYCFLGRRRSSCCLGSGATFATTTPTKRRSLQITTASSCTTLLARGNPHSAAVSPLLSSSTAAAAAPSSPIFLLQTKRFSSSWPIDNATETTASSSTSSSPPVEDATYRNATAENNHAGAITETQDARRRAAHDAQWNQQLAKVQKDIEQQQQKKHASSDSNKPNWPKDVRLRGWLAKQKHLYRNKIQGEDNSLTDERYQKLVEIGIDLDKLVHEMRTRREWQDAYVRLCEYVEKHNGTFPDDIKTPKDELDKEGQYLVCWMKRQRSEYKTYHQNNGDNPPNYQMMNKEQIEKLNDIGFIWNKHEDLWQQRYSELQAYHRDHGHCMVPAKYASNEKLSKWVLTQRTQYSKFIKGGTSSMTQTRINLLNELGFIWNANDAKWQTKYKELEAYVNRNGFGSLPPRKDPNFHWVRNQRTCYNKWLSGKDSSMTQERKDLLEKLGVLGQT